ncbi:hypothetical protein [Vaccinia virus]|uniref:Uncharacterized protein n=1 Tax=Vaccinia virus TaxID=10245 RepID=A0A2I6J1B8_VACCV|nr:hypothetical protein [Vaccinia virus]
MSRMKRIMDCKPPVDDIKLSKIEYFSDTRDKCIGSNSFLNVVKFVVLVFNSRV